MLRAAIVLVIILGIGGCMGNAFLPAPARGRRPT
jgi:hypothetical protein